MGLRKDQIWSDQIVHFKVQIRATFECSVFGDGEPLQIAEGTKYGKILRRTDRRVVIKIGCYGGELWITTLESTDGFSVARS